MENFIDGVGERYIERKANAVPQQLENLVKKQVRGAPSSKHSQSPRGSERPSHSQDEELARLRKELAAAKSHKAHSQLVSRPRSRESSRASREPHEMRRSMDGYSHSRKSPSIDGDDTRSYHEPDRPSLSQAEINRLALQHADDSHVLPLKAKNLELLARQEQCVDRTCKHGGSAALLHTSHSHSHSQSAHREMLPYSGHDLKGNPSTEAFRPHRTSDRDLYLIEVMEEQEEPEEPQPRRSRRAEYDVRQSDGEWRKKQKDPVVREREAKEIARTGSHTFYKIG